jgi:hypothetical protein
MSIESTKSMLAILIVTAVCVCIWALFYYVLPVGSKEIILILIGYLTAAFQQVYGYYFGSSEGSSRKTEILKGETNEKSTTVIDNSSTGV